MYSSLFSAAKLHVSRKSAALRQYESNEVKTAIKSAETILSKFGGEDDSPSLRQTFEHVANIEDLVSAGDQVVDLLDDKQSHAQNVSDSYMLEITNEYLNIVRAATAARAAINDHLTGVLGSLVLKVTSLSALPVSADEIHEIFMSLDGRGVAAYTIAMNEMLEAPNANHGAIMDMVDAAKDFVLGIDIFELNQESNLEQKSEPDSGQREIAPTPFQRFGLLPRDDAAIKSHASLYCFHCPTATPLEYDFSTLGDASVAGSLDSQITSNMGINDAVVTKWALLRRPHFVNIANIANIANESMGDPSNNTSVMRVFSNGDAQSLGDAPTSIINRMRRGPSSRIAKYHEREASEIVNHVNQMPVQTATKLLSKQTPRMNILMVSNRVITATMDFFERTLRERPPKSLRALGNIIGNELDEIVGNIVMAAPSGSPHIEELVTWLVGVDALVRSYIRYINEGIARSGIKEKMFREKTEDELMRLLVISIRKIVESAAKKAFDPDRDTYEAVVVKMNLLGLPG